MSSILVVLLSFVIGGFIAYRLWWRMWQRVWQRLKRVLLRDNRGTMLTLTRHMPEPALITDQSGRIIAYSPSACELFGYKPDEILNMSVEALIPNELAHHHRILRNEFMQSRSGKAMDNEISCLSKTGGIIAAITRVRTFAIDGKNYAFVSIQDLRKFKNREAMFKNLAEQDALTGLANRRLFDHDLEREWHRALRNQKPLTLMMIDVDFFKQYNDYYGHPAGDTCLIKIAEIMQGVIHRGTDCIARYGGEEFICLLPLLREQDAINKADTIRRRVEAAKIPHQRSKVSDWVTISIGVATVIPDASQGFKSFVAAADAALYRAKGEGRNCVKMAE